MTRIKALGLIAALALAVSFAAYMLRPLPAPAAGTLPQVAAYQNTNGPTASVACDQTARMTAASASAVLVTHVAGLTTYVCSYSLNLGLVASTTAQLVWGTGTTCGTGTVSSSALLSIGTTVTGNDPIIADGSGDGAIDSSPVAGTSDLCLNITGSAVVSGIVRFAQF